MGETTILAIVDITPLREQYQSQGIQLDDRGTFLILFLHARMNNIKKSASIALNSMRTLKYELQRSTLNQIYFFYKANGITYTI